MRKTFLLLLMLLALSSGKEKNTWTSLLDKDLSQWDNYLSYAYPEGYDGEIPLDEEGNPMEPVGLNQHQYDVFTVVEEHGEPVLRISGEIYGCVVTKKEFENYLSAETALVENDINHFKQQALDNISDIASEFSKELIEKITGTKPNDSNLKAIISEISKKHKESRYV